MKKIHVTLCGKNTLMMHSTKTVNPLNEIAKAIKELTSKKNKTEEDLQTISDLEWEGGLYYEDELGLHIPIHCIKAVLEAGAKFNKMGKNVNRFCQFLSQYAPLDIGEKFDLDKARAKKLFRDVRSVVVQRNRVLRSRPRFDYWRTEFDMTYDEEHIDLSTIIKAFDMAGEYVGLLEGRSLGYGRFDTSIEEVAL